MLRASKAATPAATTAPTNTRILVKFIGKLLQPAFVFVPA
jgi:hypothetical protein